MCNVVLILGQQLHHLYRISLFKGINPLCDHCPGGGIVRCKVLDPSRVRAVRMAGKRLPRSRQGVFHRRNRGSKYPGRFFRAPAEHISEDERGALPGRQALYERYKPEADVLTFLTAVFGGLGGAEAVFGNVAERLPAWTVPLDMVDAQVVRNSIEPCTDTGSPLKTSESAISADE